MNDEVQFSFQEVAENELLWLERHIKVCFKLLEDKSFAECAKELAELYESISHVLGILRLVGRD